MPLWVQQEHLLSQLFFLAVFWQFCPSNRINMAVIGCGRQSVTPNIPQLLASKHAQLVGVCDVDAWRLANAVKQVNDEYSKQKGTTYNGCKAFDDYRKVMQSKEIDAVMISLPDHWHVPMAVEAARAGNTFRWKTYFDLHWAWAQAG